MANEFPATSHFMDGVLRCSRYAFGPNRLHYCGPDANCEIHSYINESASDPGLRQLLREFQTMFPYLRHIADVNGIPDPFDERVVEAYWLGNELLEKINAHAFYRHLIEDQRIRDKIGAKSFELVAQKIGQGAVPHHSFHVFDVWKRAGRADHEHTLEWMDECRISWGTVLTVDGPTLTVLTEPLTLTQGKFALGNPMERKLVRRLEAEYDIEQVKPNNIVSIHWGVPCEVISRHQAAMLKKYTLRHIYFANQTI